LIPFTTSSVPRSFVLFIKRLSIYYARCERYSIPFNPFNPNGRTSSVGTSYDIPSRKHCLVCRDFLALRSITHEWTGIEWSCACFSRHSFWFLITFGNEVQGSLLISSLRIHYTSGHLFLQTAITLNKLNRHPAVYIQSDKIPRSSLQHLGLCLPNHLRRDWRIRKDPIRVIRHLQTKQSLEKAGWISLLRERKNR
jgi:hypothetical protein